MKLPRTTGLRPATRTSYASGSRGLVLRAATMLYILTPGKASPRAVYGTVLFNCSDLRTSAFVGPQRLRGSSLTVRDLV